MWLSLSSTLTESECSNTHKPQLQKEKKKALKSGPLKQMLHNKHTSDTPTNTYFQTLEFMPENNFFMIIVFVVKATVKI